MGAYPPNMDISSEFRNLNLTSSQHNQSTPPMTAEIGNQNSSQDREPSHHNSQSRGESNIMSSTMIVPPNGNSGDSESDSDDPDVGNVFEDSEGQKDFKVCMIYWMARYKEKSKQKDNPTAKTGHKINYGRVHPPTLHLESELRSFTFEIWKKQWQDFYEKSNMFESEGLAFLKEFSVPDPGLKQLIALCETVDTVFELLSTQFSDKGTDYRILVKYICGLPALKENYDFQHQQNVIKKILKYLTLYNRVFSPERDLDKNELEGSMLSWIPKSQTQISMRKFIQEIKEGKELKGDAFSKTYHDILTKELNIITNLQANEETKKDMYGVTGFQTLNIVEDPREQEISQDESQDEINVHYGTNNNPKNTKNNPHHKTNIKKSQIQSTSPPQKIKILTRDQSGSNSLTQNLNSPCMICKSSEHPSHRCIKIRQLRDKKQPIPSNFCETHCGRITPLCSNKACAIVKLKNGRLLNLTCQKPNHSNKHFLLCDIETCRKNSEKYWKKLQERNEVVHFTPAEDLEDIDSEDIEIDVEDFDTKLAVSDEIDINLNCFPTLNIKNSDNDNTPITHTFLKTFFELENSLG